jgi:hypothetical protein
MRTTKYVEKHEVHMKFWQGNFEGVTIWNTWKQMGGHTEWPKSQLK